MFIGEKTVFVDDTHTLSGKRILDSNRSTANKGTKYGEDDICKSNQFLELNELQSNILYLLEVGIFRLSCTYYTRTGAMVTFCIVIPCL